MHFGLKRSCKNCHFEDNGDGKCRAGVKTINVQNGARKPTEPCYKPVTYSQYRVHLDIMMPMLSADLALYRSQ